MQIDPDAPAYPQQITIPGGSWNPIRCRRVPNGETDVEFMPGLTIRAEIASRVLAGLLSDPQSIGTPEIFADSAVKFADALIAALNQPKP